MVVAAAACAAWDGPVRVAAAPQNADPFAGPPPAFPCRSPGGRLVFELRTSKGQWLRTAETATSFVLALDPAARAAGLAPPPPPAAAPAAPAARAGPGPVGEAVEDAAAVALAAHAVGKGRAIGKGGREAKPARRAAEAAAAPARAMPAAAPAAADTTDDWSPVTSSDDFGGADLLEISDLLISDRDGWDVRGLLRVADVQEEASAAEGPPDHDLIRQIASEEHKAERSLMHRFQIACDLVGSRALAALRGGDAGAAARALAALAVWLRFSSLRLLRW